MWRVGGTATALRRAAAPRRLATSAIAPPALSAAVSPGPARAPVDAEVANYTKFVAAPSPREVVAVPLSAAPLFPGVVSEVLMNSRMVDHLTNAAQPVLFGGFLRRSSGGTRVGPVTDVRLLHPIGTLCCVSGMRQFAPGENAVYQVGLSAVSARPIRITGVVPNRALLTVTIEELPPRPHAAPDDGDLLDLARRVALAIAELGRADPALTVYRNLIGHNELDLSNPAEIADLAAAALTLFPEEQQRILECADLRTRLTMVLELMGRHRGVLGNVDKLLHQYSEADMAVYRDEKERFINSLVVTLDRMIGKSDGGSAGGGPMERLRAKFESSDPPQAVRDAFEREMSRLAAAEKNATEAHTLRNYLEWLAALPWGKRVAETYNVAAARTVLEKDHFGLKDVKERILEFTAVGNLRGSVRGRILCLAGPPGVGKTSIAKSIAHSLGREFFRISVGGLHDMSEIKGHRRTYVGSMPGRIIQGFKTVSSENPVILIDEIDKMGVSAQGDPSAALLEVLDPEQNSTFLDHFLDLPFDLSNVLFVCTANDTDTIPRPLLDRMEVIQLSGYVMEEKEVIARDFLLPRIIAETGLPPSTLNIAAPALRHLIDRYCREPGVRRLEQLLERIARKAAVHVAVLPPPEVAGVSPGSPRVRPIRIGRNNLAEFVGLEEFPDHPLYGVRLPVGVVMGLAWTSMGGASLYVESVPLRSGGPRRRRSPSAPATAAVEAPAAEEEDQDGGDAGGGAEPNGSGGASPGLVATGRLGRVMSESLRVAKVFAKNYLFQLVNPRNAFFDDNTIHVHFPEGATPKDGPSAGVTVATSLLSAALRRPVLPRLAMTGELSLTGKVLPIGGVKEKTLAARRSGVRHIIFPRGNQRDWDELDATVRGDLRVYFAENYDDVFAVAFPAK